MKPLPVKTQWAVIRACVRNYHRVCSVKRSLRYIVSVSLAFTDERKEIMQWLRVCGGDWQHMAACVGDKFYWPKLDAWAKRQKGGAP